MKKAYIKPNITMLATDEEALMAASPAFSGSTKYDPTNPATPNDVCAKKHSLWDEAWDEPDENDTDD